MVGIIFILILGMNGAMGWDLRDSEVGEKQTSYRLVFPDRSEEHLTCTVHLDRTIPNY